MDRLKYTEEQREFFRKAGAKGGKKATVPHRTEGYCRCAVCRKSRGERGREKEVEVEVKADEDFDFGA